MFVATLPYRIQIDPCSSFEQLVGQVRDLCLSALEHSHVPLQHIISSRHSPAFLEIMYEFITLEPNIERFDLGGAMLESMSLLEVDYVAKFDVMFTLYLKPSTACHFR